jgi:hypothetical protein
LTPYTAERADSADVDVFLRGARPRVVIEHLSAVAPAVGLRQDVAREHELPTYGDEDSYHIAGTTGSLSIPSMRLKIFPGKRVDLYPMILDLPVSRES